MPPSRRQHDRLAQKVAAQLRRAIVAGEFPPGSRVSEESLAANLGVSRSPIREALIELELRGLVEFEPTGHTRVPSLAPEDIRQIYTVRLMLDPVAAGLAATHATADTFAALEANLAALQAASNLTEITQLDTEFHDLIVRASANRPLLMCWTAIRDQVALWLSQMQVRREAFTHRTRDDSTHGHRVLIEAIRSGDSGRAASEAHYHIATWMTYMPPAADAGQAET